MRQPGPTRHESFKPRPGTWFPWASGLFLGLALAACAYAIARDGDPELILLLAWSSILLAASAKLALRLRRERSRQDAFDQSETSRLASESRFRVLFEASNDAIFLFNERGLIDCNPQALRLFGYADKAAILFLHPADLSPPTQPDGQDSTSAADQHMREALASGRRHFEWIHLKSDGTAFTADILLSAFDLGGQPTLQATVRDITDEKRKEREAERLGLLYATVSQINEALLRSETREAVSASICRILVESGLITMAWVGWVDAATRKVVPVACCGDDTGYLDHVAIYASDDRPEGRGPTGLSIQEDRAFFSRLSHKKPVDIP